MTRVRRLALFSTTIEKVGRDSCVCYRYITGHKNIDRLKCILLGIKPSTAIFLPMMHKPGFHVAHHGIITL